MNLLTIGSVAYDSIKTPFGSVDKALGGSASYCSLAASYFARPAIVAVVGDDFATADEKILAGKNIDLTGLQKIAGKTFAWGGEYSFDMNSRTTLFTELNVFETFKPVLSEEHKKAEYVFLGNIHPALQLEVLNQIPSPKLVGLDTMNFWMEKALGDLKKVLAKIDILIINDSEARELSREHNLIKAAKIISAMLKQSDKTALIIKRGEYGLLLFSQNLSLRVHPKQSESEIAASPAKALTPRNDIQVFNLPGYPLKDVIDPTGAGDSFAGGFMGYL
ncbi:MAG: PfkB family carbohydrate kinase, partial [Patescibacteria group bacterium]